MFKIFKPKHVHKWELVACNDEYYTNYTDVNKKVVWNQRFYKCDCGARKHEDSRTSKHQIHEGLESAKKNWIDAGVIPINSYHPSQSQSYIKIDDLEREKLDPVLEYQKTLEDISKSLKVVLNRDFALEAKYPKLKEAADEYHRQLDKYRNFENLKETN